MNDRIIELAAQAWVDNDQLDACGYTDLEKFANLIISDCCSVLPRQMDIDRIKNNFGED